MKLPELKASVQKQTWNDDRTVDIDGAISFDAAKAMLSLGAPQFHAVAKSIMSGSHDIDDLAINAGIVDAWLVGDSDNTFLVTVDEDDFSEWLSQIGLDETTSLSVTDDALAEIRAMFDVNLGAKTPFRIASGEIQDWRAAERSDKDAEKALPFSITRGPYGGIVLTVGTAEGDVEIVVETEDGKVSVFNRRSGGDVVDVKMVLGTDGTSLVFNQGDECRLIHIGEDQVTNDRDANPAPRI